jgi:hypothetical protein
MTIWSILGQLEIFYGHLVYFVVIWYLFPRFGILEQEKSGNLFGSCLTGNSMYSCGMKMQTGFFTKKMSRSVG